MSEPRRYLYHFAPGDDEDQAVWDAAIANAKRFHDLVRQHKDPRATLYGLTDVYTTYWAYYAKNGDEVLGGDPEIATLEGTWTVEIPAFTEEQRRILERLTEFVTESSDRWIVARAAWDWPYRPEIAGAYHMADSHYRRPEIVGIGGLIAAFERDLADAISDYEAAKAGW